VQIAFCATDVLCGIFYGEGAMIVCFCVWPRAKASTEVAPAPEIAAEAAALLHSHQSYA